MNYRAVMYPLIFAAGLSLFGCKQLTREFDEMKALEAAESNPKYFLEKGVVGNPVNPYWKTSGEAIAMGDLDNDGDIDMVTAGQDNIKYFENVGSRESPRFIDKGPIGRAAGDFRGSDWVNPVNVALADLNGDGYLDIITASEYGVKWFENTMHPE